MRPKLESGSSGAYFAAPAAELRFIPSGAKILDCVLGGGWPLGRISNIVGDKSTGKTLLAIEACANFARAYPDGDIWYNETEASFDKGYASALGLPKSRLTLVEDCDTVEDFFEHLEDEVIAKLKGRKRSGLYILDSLDALSDRAELDRKIDAGSYGAAKAKKMSELFRRMVRKIRDKRLHVLIVSQVRDNIGVKFGERHTRTGGKALDFYASQVLFLAQTGRVKKTINKVNRTVGVEIRARCKKNKVGLPQRECDFTILFGYGVDDLSANLDWLESVGGEVDLSGMSGSEKREAVDEAVVKKWYEIEQGFLPKRRKYG